VQLLIIRIALNPINNLIARCPPGRYACLAKFSARLAGSTHGGNGCADRKPALSRCTTAQ
jgi:hypothetical protein